MSIGRGRRSGDSLVGRPSRLAVAALMSGVLALALGSPAAADKGDHAFPSRDQIADAERHVEATARNVGAIKAQLLMANQRLQSAATEAEMASEAYNGAMWRLDTARRELATARAEAADARRAVDAQRDEIGALVAASYQRGEQLAAVNALMDADGPESVMDHYATFQGAHDSLQADYGRFAAAGALAEAFEQRAEKARAKAVRLAAEARSAKERATAAARAAQDAAEDIAAEKDRLIRELARAQEISVSLARQRQTALEELARQRAAERARAQAEEAARAQAAEDARASARSRGAAKNPAVTERRETRPRRNHQTISPRPATPQPAPAPPPPQPSRGSGGAERAIAFAKAQLGERYVWGAAGPDTWDCSGLMLRAWEQSGVSLPHYSVAQYYAGTPISVGDLRPGDLVFWGTSSSPESIHHVAMYIGDGMVIHAPRTGRPVSIDGLYYWDPPNFFARV